VNWDLPAAFLAFLAPPSCRGVALAKPEAFGDGGSFSARPPSRRGVTTEDGQVVGVGWSKIPEIERVLDPDELFGGYLVLVQTL